MDFNTTIDIIIKDLREARDIIDDFKNYEGVPEFQVELAKSKCKSAEDIIAILKTIKVNFPQQQPVNVERPEKARKTEKAKRIEESKSFSPSEPVERKDLIDMNDVEEDVLPAEKVRFTKRSKKTGSSADSSIFKEPDLDARVQSNGKSDETGIIADKFSETASTVHEQIGSIMGDDDISSVLSAMPVTDINDAIGINDKFLYLREVFDGNQAYYDEAIDRLNKAQSLPDAKAIIMSYTGVSDESEVVQQLLDLVKRKLSSDE